MESLGNYLLEMRKEHKDEMKKDLKTKYIGYWGELFALNYLENLLKRKNNIKNCNIIPQKDHEDFDLEISINNRSYKIEVKFSAIETGPTFHQIHFNNDFDYLLLIWHPSDEEIYFAILTKKEARDIATLENTEREDEDNWKIHTISIFDENFLKKLAMLLDLNKELEDLEDSEKLYLIEKAEELVIKEHKDAEINDFDGETYQQWFYDYLSNYTDDVEMMPRGYKYDINYKGKWIEIKYSVLNSNNEFWFGAIKPNNFDFILFIGFDNKENKFYFEIESKEEYIENKRERVGSDDIASQNGNKICVGKSFFTYGNDFYFDDLDNYINTH